MRTVCHFSCGAASAVATKITLGYNPDALILNAFVKEEHPDNRRFLTDCEQWFGRKVTVVQDEKWGASTDALWKQKMYFGSTNGAPCSAELKHRVLDAMCLPGDMHIFGFTAEERDRADDFADAKRGMKVTFPLIERNLTHADCLAMVKDAGIELPLMYRLGYKNANCVGCCKGGMGYWNKIRKDFPDRFDEVAAIQEAVAAKRGPNAYWFRDSKTGERFGLVQLRPDQGRVEDEPDISCSFFCAIAQQEIEAL